MLFTSVAHVHSPKRLSSNEASTPLMDRLNVLQITDAVDSGKSQLAALGAATPLLADAMALSMPCREMCDAVMSSCSCGKESTFGALLQAVIDKQNQVSVCWSSKLRLMCVV